MIDPQKMIVLWDSDDEFRITKLRVVNIDEQTPQIDNLPASAGACDEGWLESGRRVVNTPLGLYAHLATAYGFKSREQAIQILREFQKVSGQDWARQLARAAGDDSEDRSDDD
jgi:hypothetical protein